MRIQKITGKSSHVAQNYLLILSDMQTFIKLTAVPCTTESGVSIAAVTRY